MQPRSAAPPWPLWAWFIALALVVAGPLLGSGHLLLLDFPSGPRFPEVVFFPLPSSGDVGNAIPLTSLHAALRWIHPLLPEKLFLLAPIVIGGVGAARFVMRRLEMGTLPAAYAGTLFAVNPYVYDRLTAGHLYLLLAYALLPWAFASLATALDRPERRTVIAVALWLAALCAVDLHIGGMFAMLVLVGALVGHGRRDLVAGAAALGLAALLSAYWLLPGLFTTPGPKIGMADLGVYASRPGGWAVLAHLLGLHGFWRDEFTGATQRIPLLALLLIPILWAAATGLRHLLGMERERRWVLTLGIGSVLALFLAAGTSFPPTAGVFRWLFDHLPFMAVYREPQKFVALVALALALFGGAGVARWLEALNARRESSRVLQVGATAALIAAVLVSTYPILWGLWGQVSLSRYPDGWAQAEEVMDRTGPGRLLVLPWDLYAVWRFTDGRIVANPAPSYFGGREVLAADEAGFRGFPLQSRDPFSIYIGKVLEHRDEVWAFGHLMAPLDVRYVALFRDGDWRRYEFVLDQGDLTEVYRDASVVLLENEAWRAGPLELTSATTIQDPAEIIGTPHEELVTTQLFESPPLAPMAEGRLAWIARLLPAGREVPPSTSPFVSTADRCTDGWMLSGQPALCGLGVVAVYGGQALLVQAWQPTAAAQVVGVSVVALAALGTLFYRRSHNHRRREALVSDEPPPGDVDAVRSEVEDPAPTRYGALARDAIIVAVGLAIVALSISLASTRADGPGAARGQHEPQVERGASCEPLKAAFGRYVEGDVDGLARAADRARRTAEQTLTQSGAVFGAPERVAVELSAVLEDGRRSTGNEEVRYLLEKARTACSKLNRWPQ